MQCRQKLNYTAASPLLEVTEQCIGFAMWFDTLRTAFPRVVCVIWLRFEHWCMFAGCGGISPIYLHGLCFLAHRLNSHGFVSVHEEEPQLCFTQPWSVFVLAIAAYVGCKLWRLHLKKAGLKLTVWTPFKHQKLNNGCHCLTVLEWNQSCRSANCSLLACGNPHSEQEVGWRSSMSVYMKGICLEERKPVLRKHLPMRNQCESFKSKVVSHWIMKLVPVITIKCIF